MKKIIGYVISLAIVLSMAILPSATSASAETTFAEDGIFTFDNASDVYTEWGTGTAEIANGSLNASFSEEWQYEAVLFPVKLKADESYTVKINYNVPTAARLYVFYTQGAKYIDKTNNVIEKVLEFGSTSGDTEKVFSFTANDDTKPFLGVYFENCSKTELTAKINYFGIKKTTTGEATLGFNDSLDVAHAWKYGTNATLQTAASDGENSVIAASLPQWGQARIAFPVKLEAGKTYKYQIKIRSDAGLSNTFINLFAGNATGAVGNPEKNYINYILYDGTVSQTYSYYAGEFTVESSKIDETNNLLSLFIKNGNASQQTYYIDSVAISEKKTVTSKAQDTIDFTSLSDITASAVNANNVTAPVVRHDAENGKVCVDYSNSQWASARIGLPIRLEKDTDYIFTIRYKSSKATTYRFLAGSDTTPLQYYYIDNSKLTLTVSNEVQELQMVYKASDGKVTDVNNLLGLYFESSVADAHTLEIYSISYQSQKTVDGDGTVNFNSSLSYIKRGSANKATVDIGKIDGTSALAIDLPQYAQVNIELPVKLKTGGIYKYTIRYNLDADTQSGLYLNLSAAPSGTSWVNKSENYVAKPIENGKGAQTGQGFNTGTFAATAYKDIETNDTLFFFIKSDSASGKKIYIKSITIELLKGDFNGDCEINSVDLIYMRKALLEGDVTDTDYDINKDNVVDIRDLVKIKKNAVISPVGDSFNGYSLVFADDFEGTTLDSGWTFNTFTNETVKIKASGNNYSLSNGKLTLSSNSDGNGYTTATEMFRNDFSFTHGYFEMRAKLATGGGTQSAFWGKGTSIDQEPNYAAEIDVFETFGRPNGITSCFHSWWKDGITVPGLDTTKATVVNGKNSIQHIKGTMDNMTGENWQTVSGADTKFHTYGCEWTGDYIKYYVDRVCYCTVDLTKHPGEYVIFSGDNSNIRLFISHALILAENESMTPANDQTKYPSEFVVDYVRLYQGANSKYISE